MTILYLSKSIEFFLQIVINLIKYDLATQQFTMRMDRHDNAEAS